MLKKIFGKSWQSSAAGYVAAIAMVVGEAYERKVEDPKAPPITINSVLPAVAAAVLGRFYKEAAEKQAIEDARAKRDAHITADVVEKKIVDAVAKAEVAEKAENEAEKPASPVPNLSLKP